MSSVAERVIKVIIERFNVKPEEAVEDASFVDDLGADSLATVELVMAFEDEFDIEITDEEAGKIFTVGDAITHIQKRVDSKQGEAS